MRSLSIVAIGALSMSVDAFMVPRIPKLVPRKAEYALWGYPGGSDHAIYPNYGGSGSQSSAAGTPGSGGYSAAATSAEYSVAAYSAAAYTPGSYSSADYAYSTPGGVSTPGATAVTSAASGATGSASATTTFPESSGSSQLDETYTVTGSFDGGMYAFGRGVDCSGQDEGGDSDAVFEIEEGGSLSNVIIAADQTEGIHCAGACTLTNVWWAAVCEDALTIKQESGTSYVIGGGAQGADDKVIQHNGGGTVSISGFYVSDFGKLYRSCGNCDTQYERHVIIDGVVAESGSELAGINSNYGDTATITNTCATDVEDICVEYEGTDDNDAEPEETSSGPSSSCIYTTSDVAAC